MGNTEVKYALPSTERQKRAIYDAWLLIGVNDETTHDIQENLPLAIFFVHSIFSSFSG
jgi:hypothetical protein